MKIARLARLALALTPLCLTVLPQPVPAQAASANSSRDGLPANAPPLTPAQKQKQQALIARFQQNVAALQANTTMSPAQKQQQANALKVSLDKQMLALLTPAQRSAVIKQNSTVLGLRQQFMKQHQADIQKEQQLQAQLQQSMTAQQKQQLGTIQAQTNQQLLKLRDDPKMTGKVKQQTALAIMSDATRQGMNVLTPKQQSELKQLKAIQTRVQKDLTAFARAHGQQ